MRFNYDSPIRVVLFDHSVGLKWPFIGEDQLKNLASTDDYWKSLKELIKENQDKLRYVSGFSSRLKPVLVSLINLSNWSNKKMTNMD